MECSWNEDGIELEVKSKRNLMAPTGLRTTFEGITSFFEIENAEIYKMKL